MKNLQTGKGEAHWMDVLEVFPPYMTSSTTYSSDDDQNLDDKTAVFVNVVDKKGKEKLEFTTSGLVTFRYGVKKRIDVKEGPLGAEEQ